MEIEKIYRFEQKYFVFSLDIYYSKNETKVYKINIDLH